MTPDDAVLAYDADHGWHLLPSFALAARYGDNLDRAVTMADLREQVCRHERQAVERNLDQIAKARGEGLTDQQIAWALDVPVTALPISTRTCGKVAPQRRNLMSEVSAAVAVMRATS